MIKVISTDFENKTVTYDLYLIIPSENNSAGISWFDAIELDGSFETETVSEVDYIKQRRTFRFSSTNLTNAQRLAELVAEHETVKTELTGELSAKLKFTGYEIADS